MREPEIHHAAKIRVSCDYLLDILDFRGGRIVGMYNDEQHLFPNYLTLLVEHPDLPKVSEFEPVPELTPAYTITYGDNGVPIKVERVEPKKEVIHG